MMKRQCADMSMRRCADWYIVLVFFLFSHCLNAQDVILPMDIPPYLSGNFGELRSNHFHSGIDFKTQGREGVPVKSVQDGFISRVSVSPYGYGRAVYVDHPDGTTSVYAHLSRFSPALESAVRDSQYVRERFQVNLTFTEEDFPVKQNELIAYSGNTGGSGGPHLHFEIRNTQSEHPVDPLSYYKNRIRDTRPPELRSIRVYPQQGTGIVNNSTEDQMFSIAKDAEGKSVINETIYAWGNIGLGIKSYDKMDETTNIYGVYEVILNIDGTKVFHSIMDEFSFNDSRYINSFIDWKDWRDNRSFHMKSFIEPANRLKIYYSAYSGIIPITEERKYNCEYILKDTYGNTSTLHFSVTGKKTEIPEYRPSGVYFGYNQDNTYESKGVKLEIPKNSLYSSCYLDIDTFTYNAPYAPLYRIGERLPLHSSCPLVLDIKYDSYPDKTKYGIVSVNGGKMGWIGGKYESGKMRANIRETGDFTILTDTIPPEIRAINQNKWTVNRRISFKVTDDLSGISEWKGTINDQFVLFEYDAKYNSLFCTFDPKRMKKGGGELQLQVRDSAGNIAEKRISLP
ncbi:M23 family metallopeptidase [Bacteroidales bacterium OttesenSCG-928-A17]|nr:M23 family metallopeptidase [Bacteroidales bacterium OttesenSCG-928-A17]